LVFIFVWVTISASVSIFSFAAYVYLQHEILTVPVAFTALSYFSLIQNPLYQIPDFAVKILQLRVSINRLENFLGENEIEQHARGENREESNTLAFEQATLKYPGSKEAFELQNINLDFKKGGLTIITGPVGAGKSSLLLGLLGELELISGKVTLPRSVSYAAQQPWLESLTVRDNM
jgi:ABC-type multidrug transport system fused ATPase/permease subunit